TLSGQAGQRISETVETVSAAIDKTLTISQEYAKQDGQTMTTANEVIKRVVDHFHQNADSIVRDSEAMRGQNEAVNQEIAEVLMALQFQDRVSQMLCHVQSDLTRLEDSLTERRTQVHGQPPTAFDSQRWLDELAQ